MAQNQYTERLNDKRCRCKVDQLKSREKQAPLPILLFTGRPNLHPNPDTAPPFQLLTCFAQESAFPRLLGAFQSAYLMFSSPGSRMAAVPGLFLNLHSGEFYLDNPERKSPLPCSYRYNQLERDRRRSISLLLSLLYSQQHRYRVVIFKLKRLT